MTILSSTGAASVPAADGPDADIRDSRADLRDETRPDATTEAEYALETPVRCPACGEVVASLKAVRLIRTRVNFTSTLPRRGRIACPHCLAILPAELTNF